MNRTAEHQDLIREWTHSIGIGLMLLMAGMCIKWYAAWLQTDQIFHLKRIEIYGNDLLDEQRILRLSSLDEVNSIWQADLKNAETGIESVGFIQNAIVKRKLPNIIEVHVEEKQPVALLSHRGKLFSIDPSGLVLPSEPGRVYDLPILRGHFIGHVEVGLKLGGNWVAQGLTLLYTVRQDTPELYGAISEVILNGEGIQLVTTEGGIPVKIGNHFEIWKIRCLAAILRELDRENSIRQTQYIDLRYHGQVVVGRSA